MYLRFNSQNISKNTNYKHISVELVTVILRFLKILSLKDTFTHVYQYFRKSGRNTKSKGCIFKVLHLSFKEWRTSKRGYKSHIHLLPLLIPLYCCYVHWLVCTFWLTNKSTIFHLALSILHQLYQLKLKIASNICPTITKLPITFYCLIA